MTTDSWIFLGVVTVPLVLLMFRSLYMLYKTTVALKRFLRDSE